MSREYTRRLSTLGSIPTHGPIIFYDNFDNLLNWYKTAGVGDSIFELDPSISFSSNQSLFLKTRTTDAAQSDGIAANSWIYLTPSLRLNQSVFIRSTDFTKMLHLTIAFHHYDYTNVHRPGIRFTPATPSWQYADTGENYQDIPNSAYKLSANCWHRIQLIADLKIGKYISLIVNTIQFDLSPYDFQVVATPTPAYLWSQIGFLTAGAAPGDLNISGLLLYEL